MSRLDSNCDWENTSRWLSATIVNVACSARAAMETMANAAQMNFKLTPAMILDAPHWFR